MTISKRELSPYDTQSLLNRLILVCNDGARAQTAASLVVRGDRRAWLEDTAERRRTFVHELNALVDLHGGTPVIGTSTMEVVRSGISWVGTLLVGGNVGDAYGSCARIEGNAEEIYERASLAELPEPARSTIARQHAEIVSDRAELRRLSMGG